MSEGRRRSSTSQVARTDVRTRIVADSELDPALRQIGVHKVELPPRDARAYVSIRYGTPPEAIDQVRVLARFCWPDKHIVVVEAASPDLGSRNRRHRP